MKIILLLAASSAFAGHAAFAHAFLDHASPAVGAEVASPPPALLLTYTEPVEPLFSSVTVTDSHGSAEAQGKPEARDGGRTLVVSLKPLPPGEYHVAWHVTSVDTHKTEGHFTFSVRP